MKPTQTASNPSVSASPAGTQRLMSIDALRGFDMFWIVGAEDIVAALHKVNHGPVVNFVATQLTHKEWEGVAFYDLIFPLFVFIVGVSLVFSLSRTIEQQGRATAYKRVIYRGVALYLLGLFYYGGFAEGIERIRLMGVLQRIAISYVCAGLLFCTFRVRGLIAACAALLVGYWALMTFVPIPEFGAGNFAEGKNLTNYIDKQYLPLRKWDGDHDPEGLLSNLPAIGTCLLGVFAGLLLKNRAVAPSRKVAYLLGAGAVSVVLGFAWGLQFPVIKKLWTSSYVLVAAGYSAIFLAIFYQLIEIWNYRKWAMPFVWIGMNAITIYMLHNLVNFSAIANRLVGGPIKSSFGQYGEVLVTAVVVAITFAIVHFLYRKKLFLRL
jgi:predicted acyltransferase